MTFYLYFALLACCSHKSNRWNTGLCRFLCVFILLDFREVLFILFVIFNNYLFNSVTKVNLLQPNTFFKDNTRLKALVCCLYCSFDTW